MLLLSPNRTDGLDIVVLLQSRWFIMPLRSKSMSIICTSMRARPWSTCRFGCHLFLLSSSTDPCSPSDEEDGFTNASTSSLGYTVT